MLERMRRKGNPPHCWWECEMVQPLWKTVWRFLKQLKIDLPYDPAIVLLGIYPKDADAMKRRDPCTPMFLAAMSTIAQLWKEPRCPLKDEWKGHLGGSVVERLPLAKDIIPESWDQVPHQAPCMEPASPSASLSLSLYVSHE